MADAYLPAPAAAAVAVRLRPVTGSEPGTQTGVHPGGEVMAATFKVRPLCATYGSAGERAPPPPPEAMAEAGRWREGAAAGGGGPGRAEWCIDDCLYAPFAPAGDGGGGGRRNGSGIGGNGTSVGGGAAGEGGSGGAGGSDSDSLPSSAGNWELLVGSTIILVLRAHVCAR